MRSRPKRAMVTRSPTPRNPAARRNGPAPPRGRPEPKAAAARTAAGSADQRRGRPGSAPLLASAGVPEGTLQRTFVLGTAQLRTDTTVSVQDERRGQPGQVIVVADRPFGVAQVREG